MKRKVPPILRQAQLFQVELTLFNQGENAAHFQIVDSPPVEFTGSAKTITIGSPPKQETSKLTA